jgi:hypothetical protein
MTVARRTNSEQPGTRVFDDASKKLGFKRMSTAMAIFENQALALERRYVNET